MASNCRYFEEIPAHGPTIGVIALILSFATKIFDLRQYEKSAEQSLLYLVCEYSAVKPVLPRVVNASDDYSLVVNTAHV